MSAYTLQLYFNGPEPDDPAIQTLVQEVSVINKMGPTLHEFPVLLKRLTEIRADIQVVSIEYEGHFHKRRRKR